MEQCSMFNVDNFPKASLKVLLPECSSTNDWILHCYNKGSDYSPPSSLSMVSLVWLWDFFFKMAAIWYDNGLPKTSTYFSFFFILFACLLRISLRPAGESRRFTVHSCLHKTLKPHTMEDSIVESFSFFY